MKRNLFFFVKRKQVPQWIWTAAIDRLVTDKTVIVIAHRLSTVMGADLILVLDHGSIVERGIHQKLLAQSGQYARMWAAQQAARSWQLTGDRISSQ